MLNDLVTCIQIPSINNVYAHIAIHRITQRDCIATLCRFDTEKVNLEVISHIFLSFYANEVLLVLSIPTTYHTGETCQSTYQ